MVIRAPASPFPDKTGDDLTYEDLASVDALDRREPQFLKGLKETGALLNGAVPRRDVRADCHRYGLDATPSMINYIYQRLADHPGLDRLVLASALERLRKEDEDRREIEQARRARAGRARGASKARGELDKQRNMPATLSAKRRLESAVRDLVKQGDSIRSIVDAMHERGLKIGREKVSAIRRAMHRGGPA